MDEQQTGVEVAGEAVLQSEESAPVTEIVETGAETQAEAGHDDTAPVENVAWEKRISAIKQKYEQEYGTKAKDADRYQDSLNRVAKFYGFSNHEEYMVALEQAETERRIQEEADRLGVSEDVIRDYVQPLKSELDQLKQRDQQRSEADLIQRVETQIASMENDVTNYPNFAQYKVDVINMAATKGYSLDDAYKILTYDSRVTTASQQAQQEAIRRLQQNADSSTGALGADAPDQATGYMAMSPTERKAYRDRIKRGQPV
jgi:hypothetical protein